MFADYFSLPAAQQSMLEGSVRALQTVATEQGLLGARRFHYPPRRTVFELVPNVVALSRAWQQPRRRPEPSRAPAAGDTSLRP